MKKFLIIMMMAALFLFSIYVGLCLWVSLEGIRVGSFDWFPKEDDMELYRFIWLLSAIFTFSVEVGILCVELFLYKKLKCIK